MPVKASHLEFSTKVLDHCVVCVGGMHFKDPQTRKIILTDAVQVYDAKNDTWKIVGQLPFRVKSNVTGTGFGKIANQTIHRLHH